MKIIISVSLFLSLMSTYTLSQQSKIEPSLSFGLGMGSTYSGLGANIAYIGEQDMKYASYGCTSISTSGNISRCGFGIGWIRTDLLNSNTNKHGIGIYLSQVDEQVIFNFNSSETNDRKRIYALGLNYTYFNNGINNSGFNVGFSMHIDNSNDRNNIGGLF